MEPNQMQTQVHPRASAKDFFLNLGAIVALFTTVINLLNLLFTVINKAFPQITSWYDYYGSQSISFPVATLIIFFPIFILLMWVLERGYIMEPEKRHVAVRRWLTYITLFIAGITLAGDLVTVLYYFIDGRELTTGFLMKILVVFVVTLMVFLYYISDIRGKLTGMSQKVWALVSCLLILASVVWGFAVLGSPRNQQLLKYDQQKVMDLQTISNQVNAYYQTTGGLPNTLSDLTASGNYYIPFDPQTNQPYEYILVGQSAKSYQLCTTFNKTSLDDKTTTARTYPYGVPGWTHPAGRYCFTQTIPVNQYVPVKGNI